MKDLDLIKKHVKELVVYGCKSDLKAINNKIETFKETILALESIEFDIKVINLLKQQVDILYKELEVVRKLESVIDRPTNIEDLS